MVNLCAGSGMLVRSMPYQTAPSAKQAAWLLNCAVLGAVIAPICLLGEDSPRFTSGVHLPIPSAPHEPDFFSLLSFARIFEATCLHRKLLGECNGYDTAGIRTRLLDDGHLSEALQYRFVSTTCRLSFLQSVCIIVSTP